jgi:hypothetical protein
MFAGRRPRDRQIRSPVLQPTRPLAAPVHVAPASAVEPRRLESACGGRRGADQDLARPGEAGESRGRVHRVAHGKERCRACSAAATGLRPHPPHADRAHAAKEDADVRAVREHERPSRLPSRSGTQSGSRAATTRIVAVSEGIRQPPLGAAVGAHPVDLRKPGADARERDPAAVGRPARLGNRRGGCRSGGARRPRRRS